MHEIPSNIQNHQAVISIFGKWPSFYGAELLSFAIHPNDKGDLYLETQIRFGPHRQTDEISAELVQDAILVTLHFGSPALEYFKPYRPKLSEIQIIPLTPEQSPDYKFDVEIHSVEGGCEAAFRCMTIGVAGVESESNTK